MEMGISLHCWAVMHHGEIALPTCRRSLGQLHFFSHTCPYNFNAKYSTRVQYDTYTLHLYLLYSMISRYIHFCHTFLHFLALKPLSFNDQRTNRSTKETQSSCIRHDSASQSRQLEWQPFKEVGLPYQNLRGSHSSLIQLCESVVVDGFLASESVVTKRFLSGGGGGGQGH